MLLRWLVCMLCIGVPQALGRQIAAGQERRKPPVVPMPISYTSTGVAAAQNILGLTGKGTKIAIMDSGVNYAHPAFGSCKKPGSGGTCRVLRGWDFLGSYNWETGRYVADSDPMDCKTSTNTHGTQVASVAAGDASAAQKPWRGVAYQAGILAYKVSGSCSGLGTVSTNATLKAIRQATKDGADVLNLSYGDFRSGGYVDHRYAEALGAAMNRGCLVAIASGNDGLYGPWFTEGGVAAKGVLSTAAADVMVNMTGVHLKFSQPLKVQAAKTETRTIDAVGPLLLTSATLSSIPALVKKQSALKFPLKIVPAKPLIACSKTLENAAALKGSVVLIQRGQCTFAVKVANAAKAGAAAVIVFSNRTGSFDGIGFDQAPEIPAWGVELAQGKALLTAIQGSTAAKKLPPQQQQQQQHAVYLTGVENLSKEAYEVLTQPSFFSSWGPSVTMEMHPSISAPGSELHTATSGSNYTDVDGTSYAAPFMAGALALWREAQHIRQQSTQPAAAAAANQAPQPGRSGPAAAAQPVTGSSSKDGSSTTDQPGTPSAAGVAAERGLKPVKPRPRGGRSKTEPYEAPAAAAAVAGGATQQSAAFAAFVSTAKPMLWRSHKGWAQPVLRVGAGLVQVDAAIQNPITISPTHLLLRSNQPSQTLTITLRNNGPSVTIFKIGHMPAAAVTLKDVWYYDDAELLLTKLAAKVTYLVDGKAVDVITLQPNNKATVQVIFQLPQSLMAGPYIYSGYVTLTPLAAAAPAAAVVAEKAAAVGGKIIRNNTDGSKKVQAYNLAESSDKQMEQLIFPGSSSSSTGSEAQAVPYKAVPLVIPYQGFSQNYSLLPLLPDRSAALQRQHPEHSKVLRSLLNVCYASYAFFMYDYQSSDEYDTFQDGYLYQPHVSRCLSTPTDSKRVTKIKITDLQDGSGTVMLAAALTRPALRMQLMLLEAQDCSSSKGAKGSGSNSSKHTNLGSYSSSRNKDNDIVCNKAGKVLGEFWTYTDPSRDIPGQLWSYYDPWCDGYIWKRNNKTNRLRRDRLVDKNKPYKFQLWITGGLAEADRAAGEKYHTWKYDIPGTFIFV